MVRLLLVEDEPVLARAMAMGLTDEGHSVEITASCDEARASLAAGGFDGLLLDLRLPDGSGLTVLRELRSRDSQLPVLVVTACDATREVVDGLDAGADDYLTKPFAVSELTARVRAILRRAAPAAHSDGCLTWEDLRLHPAEFRAWRNDTELALGKLEFALLEQLLRRPGQPLSKARLTACLWDAESEPESNALEVHVASLRRKLEALGPRVLRTRRGVGYVLESP